MDKKTARIRRAKRTRYRIKTLNAVRLCVFRSSRHIYAQVISPDDGKIITSASSLNAEIRDSLKNGSNVDAATEVGKLVAKLALQAGIKKVAFDRSGFKYHGRVKALAEAVREGGIDF